MTPKAVADFFENPIRPGQSGLRLVFTPSQEFYHQLGMVMAIHAFLRSSGYTGPLTDFPSIEEHMRSHQKQAVLFLQKMRRIDAKRFIAYYQEATGKESIWQVELR